MIQPGQKLTDGDYFEGSKEQRDQVKPFMNHLEFCIDTHTGIGFAGFKISSEPGFFDQVGTKYSFPDFRQLCENTFGV